MDKARNKYEFPSSLLIRGKEEVRVLLGIEEEDEEGGEGEGREGGDGEGERRPEGSRRGSAMSLVKGEPGGDEKVVVVKELVEEQKGEGVGEKVEETEKKEKVEE